MCHLERWFNGTLGSVILMVVLGYLAGSFQTKLFYYSVLYNDFSITVTKKTLFK